MIGPVVVQGLKPSNVLELKEPSTGVLLVMRRPPMVQSRETAVRWLVWCQAVLETRVGDPADTPPPLVTVPPSPARRARHFVADDLLLPPLPAVARAVAVAYYPLRVPAWRFEFSTDQPEHPDAKAEAWAFAIQAPHVGCGIFRAPYRAGPR